VKAPEAWNIALVGSGNVAWHLGKALRGKGFCISQVLNHHTRSARQLAGELEVLHWGRPEDLAPEADVCLICVSDDAISAVVHRLKPANQLLVHTAGSVPLDIFQPPAVNFGVLYPVQSFTKGRPLDYSLIPFLTEANTTENLKIIDFLASSVSQRVVHADSARRLLLHLAAVFAGNFSNHMFALSEKLMLRNGLSFDLLKPLIAETTAKALAMSPKKAQTGPAVRGNTKVMAKQLDLLKHDPELQELYRLISESITQP
jgi:predicted short-subunit dehydrogenase-like oxidoreductase (DUF2520 family)